MVFISSTLASLDDFEPRLPSSSLTSDPRHISLPQEIFVEIFALLCKPLTKCEILLHDGMIYDWKIQPVTPFFLGSICKAWRSIVRSTPTLWGSIVLSLSTNLRRRIIQIELLQKWITRSCEIPLSLHLTSDDFKDGSEDWDLEFPSELYRVLDTYAERWKDLEVIFPSGYLNASLNPVMFQDIFRGNFPLLRSLALRPPLGTGIMQGKVAIALSSATAPLLQHVSIRSFYLADVTLPWMQLRSFTANALPVDECVEILRRCSSLTWCRFTFTDMYIGPNIYPLTGPVVLPNIKHFEVGISSAELISELLEPCECSCPMLEELVICLSPSTEFPPDRIFKPLLSDISLFLSRSSSPFLRSLSLLNLESEEEQLEGNPSRLIERLRAAHSIEILHLSFMQANKDGLSQSSLRLTLDPRMTIQDEEGALLPNLREFYYKGCVSSSPAILIEVLKNRWEWYDGKFSVAQLKLASIIVDNDANTFELTKNDTSRVEELVKAGMDISISVTYPK